MRLLFISVFLLIITACQNEQKPINQNDMTKIIFLHHSTGNNVWVGKTNKYLYKLSKVGDVQKFFQKYNKKNNTDYQINHRFFPASSPYGWKNYPFDYYNIWVKNAGDSPFMEEPTLEILTKEYNVIIFKHCYPVSSIKEDIGEGNIDSEQKTLKNYKLQYEALKKKMYEFPDTKFIVWTPAVHVKNNINENEAKRTLEFYNWMINEWDTKDDNIYIWDFYHLETEGGLYLSEKYSRSSRDSHPNVRFSGRVAPLFAKFIIDVIEGKIN